MQGTWKENIGGWNAKGYKRKKQTRKNTIKDKGRAILRNFSEENDIRVGRKSDDTILTNSSITKYISYHSNKVISLPKTVKLFKIRVWIEEENDKYISYPFRAYFFNGEWFDEHNIKVFNNIGSALIKYSHVEKIKLIGLFNPIQNDNKKKEDKISISYFAEGTTYLYGKPLPDYQRYKLYGYGKRRKIAQGIANSSDRVAIRDFISKFDWDKEIKTHALSKSIAWEIS